MTKRSLNEFQAVKESISNSLARLIGIVLEYEAISQAKMKIDFDKEYSSESGQSEILETQRKALEDGSFKLLILGEFSTGKSTFLNALIRENVLPVAVRPTTATINRITYHEEKSITLTFWGRINEHGEETEPGKVQEIEFGDLKKYTTALSEESDAISQKVKIVDIKYPVEYCKNSVEILDTPGLASTNDHHDRVTLNYLPNGNACLMLLNPGMPLSKSERHYLRMIRSFISRVFFIANKVNLLEDDEKSEALEYMHQELQKELGTENPVKIYPLNAKLAASGDWENSDFGDFIELLETFLTSDEKAKDILNPPINTALNVCNSLQMNIQVTVNSISFSAEEFDKRINENLPALERIKRRKVQILQFLEEQRKLIQQRITHDAEHEILSTKDKIDLEIKSWGGDIDDLKNSLPHILKEELNQLSITIQNYLADQIEQVKKDTRGRVIDLIEDLREYKSGVGGINVKPQGDFNMDDIEVDGAIANYLAKMGGAVGIGYLAGFLLGPVGVIVAVVGNFFLSNLLSDFTKGKQLEKIATVVQEHMDKELASYVPKVKESLRGIMKNYISEIDKYLMTELNNTEKMIAQIQDEKNQKQEEVESRRSAYRNLQSHLSEVEAELVSTQAQFN